MDSLKLIILIYGSTKPNMRVGGWLYWTKIHITQIFYQETYQSIPPYNMKFLQPLNKLGFNKKIRLNLVPYNDK